MYKDFEIAPTQPAVSRLRLKPAYLAALLSTLALSGCATFSPDGGMTVVANVAGETLEKDVISIRTEGDAARAKGIVQGLLRRSLTVDAAVQIALLNNRGLQASYNELALAEAAMVQESLPPNPTFSIFRIAGDSALEAERQVVGNILALSTLPFRSEIARQCFQQAQLRAAEETLRLAAEVRRTYFRAVAANELVGLLIFGGVFGVDRSGVGAMFLFSHPWTAILMTSSGLTWSGCCRT